MTEPVDKQLRLDDLSHDQREVYDCITQWVGGSLQHGERNLLTIGGVAGSGKSSLLSVFASTTKLLVAYVTLTGRAASVLQRKLAACNVRTTSGLRRTLRGRPDRVLRLV